MTQKKSRFWTFCFSFIPGAGEMYMGFMKMGLSLMTTFIGIIAVATILELGPVMFLGVIAWFYSFFHVHNLASMTDEEFYAVKDEYLFHIMDDKKQGRAFIKSYRKIIAIVLIVLGAVLTWKGLFYMVRGWMPDWMYYTIQNVGHRLPQLVVGVAIIVLGVFMIRGKKEELDDATVSENANQSDGKE